MGEVIQTSVRGLVFLASCNLCEIKIMSQCSVSPDGTCLKCDIQNIMSNVTPPKDSSSHPKPLRPIIREI